MTTLMSNKKNLAATENQEEHPRISGSRNTAIPPVNEDYTTQVSMQIEGRVTRKLSQEFSKTKSRILGALSKLYEVLTQHTRSQAGTV